MRLTKTAADAAKHPEGKGSSLVHILWCDKVPGFGLRVNPGGSKSFVLDYRQGRRKRRLALGRYGALTVAQARKLAQERLAEIAKGADPVAERRHRAKAETVRELADLYIERHALPKKKPKSIEEDRRMLRLHILPAMGSTPVESVKRADVERLHHKMKSTPYAANRVLSLCSVMFRLAEKWELRPDGSNPCRHVDRYREKRRERFLSASEMESLGQTLNDDEKARRESQSAIDAVRLLIFTGCRRDEILRLRWEHVDLDSGRLLLPDSKTGAKTVTLAAPALELLGKIRERTKGDWVIPAPRKKGERLTDLEHPWQRIRARAGIPDVRLHDLRHSFASVAAEAGFSLPMIGKLLGHRQASTTQRYAHLADDPVRAAADRVARQIDAAMAGGQGGTVARIDK